MERKGQHLLHAEGVLGEHADGEDNGADNDAGGNGQAGATNHEGGDDQQCADGVVRDGVEPGGQQTDEGHFSNSGVGG